MMNSASPQWLAAAGGCLLAFAGIFSANASAQSGNFTPESFDSAVASCAASATGQSGFKLFPADKPDIPALCRCTMDKVKDNKRVIEVVEREGFQRGGKITPANTYAATKLFAALLVCKSDQLHAVADSGALDNLPEEPVVPPATIPTYAEGPGSCLPKWPEYSRKVGATGRTSLRFVVGADGRTKKFEITRSSGDTLAHKLLDVHAIAAVAECKFKPAEREGLAVEVSASQEFQWALE